MKFAAKTLKNNGVLYDGEYEATPMGNYAKRGKQILEYLSDKTYYDFVIIDDKMFDFYNYFSRDKIIKTNIFNEALSNGKVNEFIERYGGREI